MHKRVDVRRLGTVKGCGREGWSLWARGGVRTGVGLFGIRFLHIHRRTDIHTSRHKTFTWTYRTDAHNAQTCTTHTGMYKSYRHAQNTQTLTEHPGERARVRSTPEHTQALGWNWGNLVCHSASSGPRAALLQGEGAGSRRANISLNELAEGKRFKRNLRSGAHGEAVTGTRAHINTHMHADTRTRTQAHTHGHRHTHIYTPKRTHRHTGVWVHIYMHIRSFKNFMTSW